MHEKRFDAIAKLVATSTSRRRLLRQATVGVTAGLTGLVGTGKVGAEDAPDAIGWDDVGEPLGVCGNAHLLCFKSVSDIAICNSVKRITVPKCFGFTPFPGCYVEYCGTYRSDNDACNKLVPACDGHCYARERCPGHG